MSKETFSRDNDDEGGDESSQPKRFSFYNADEFKVVAPIIASQSNNNSPGKDTRFNFYNAEEIRLTQTVVEAVEATQTKEDDDADQEDEEESSNLDSTEILKSLQEHEQQRLSILGDEENSNPYEDAIKEALELLRTHRGSEIYTNEIEERRKQRQIRMARYASRLAELKGGTTPTEHNASSPQTISNALSGTGSLSTLSNANTDEEVQRGVERVLLAILERAHTTTTTTTTNDGPQQSEEKKSYEETNDALLRAMSDLLGPNTTGDDDTDDDESLDTQDDQLPHVPEIVVSNEIDAASSRKNHLKVNGAATRQPLSLEAIPKPKTESKKQKDDELTELGPVKIPHNPRILKKDNELTDPCATTTTTILEDLEVPSVKKDVPVLPESKPKKMDLSKYKPQPIPLPSPNKKIDCKKKTISPQGDAHDELDRMVERVFAESPRGSPHQPIEMLRSDDEEEEESLDGALGSNNNNDHDGDDDSYDNESTDYDDSDRYSRVLGPLSNRSGGTTGVVLEDDDDDASSTEDDDDDDDDDDSSEEDDDSSESAQANSMLETLSAAMSYVTGNATTAATATYEDESDYESGDVEAVDLMKSLCAHLLPKPINTKNRRLEQVPDWDESNPEEAGYRIVRLTAGQLERIEKEYGTMMERHGNREDTFERDLRDAEDLLDQEERRVSAKVSGASSSPGTVTSEISTESASLDQKMEFLPKFPGVKPAGKGEMGDLEYFTLPIIFKSHVTGFEPTKDMVLEGGNVVAGQYLVEGVLGSAAFSTAYKCIDLNSEPDSAGCQEEVCLKVIKNTKDFFDQSLDEIKILELLRQTGKCNENFIVEMKSFFYHREHLVIVTELLRQNLFEFGKFIIDSGEEAYFTLTRLSYVSRQCLIALNFVHEIGLVHSDVKPENILLASYSRAQVKLIDFGSSCYLTDRQSSYIQSRSYRAPEVCLGLPYDGRIDIWSLGCVVAEMFTGEVTFQNDSLVSMLSRIEAICGPFPRHMIAQGRQSSRFFTKVGLLFEKVGRNDEESEEDEDRHIDIFQPKRTCLASRLGFSPNLMKKFEEKKSLSKDETRQALFVDFVRKLLTVDPELRPTAAEALEHPLMQYAAKLTEEDVLYPSS